MTDQPKLGRPRKLPDDEEDMKDALHELLVTNSRPGIGGCHVWLGRVQKETGIGLVSVRRKMPTAHRVAAWVWLGGFRLHDPTVRVKHALGCVPHCIHPEHLRIERRQAGIKKPA